MNKVNEVFSVGDGASDYILFLHPKSFRDFVGLHVVRHFPTTRLVVDGIWKPTGNNVRLVFALCEDKVLLDFDKRQHDDVVSCPTPYMYNELSYATLSDVIFKRFAWRRDNFSVSLTNYVKRTSVRFACFGSDHDWKTLDAECVGRIPIYRLRSLRNADRPVTTIEELLAKTGGSQDANAAAPAEPDPEMDEAELESLAAYFESGDPEFEKMVREACQLQNVDEILSQVQELQEWNQLSGRDWKALEELETQSQATA